MKRVNNVILIFCGMVLMADLSQPGQFQFASPVPFTQLKSFGDKVGPKIKQGMIDFEKNEFMPRCQAGSQRRSVSLRQLESLAGNWREGLTVAEVNRHVGEPLCAGAKTAEYATPKGILVVGYKDGKATGFELKNTRRKINNVRDISNSASAIRSDR